MSPAGPTSYEEVPYESQPFPQTHPDNVGAVATLYGMNPVPADGCRVLELGCADGGNLIPMALGLPGSRFVGIDLSPGQIAAGQAVVAALGLTNIDLRALDLLAVDAGFGTFDYIICHGVYSWVAPAAQDRILALCARNLAPDGVAYVSHNTYPGWHLRGLVREALAFHVGPIADPRQQIEQARAFLELVATATRGEGRAYVQAWAEEAGRLQAAGDPYLFHEYLEAENRPVYFHQLVERAADHGLQYLGDALVTTMADAAAPPLRALLDSLSPDLIRREQYLDILRNQTFRRTLLCHDRVTLDRTPSPEAIRPLAVTAIARPRSGRPEVLSAKAEVFETRDGRRLTTDNPLVKAAMEALHDAWPRAMPQDALVDAVRTRLASAPGQAPVPPGALPGYLAEFLLMAYRSGLVELHACPPRLAQSPGDRPFASPLARLQAANRPRVTNLRHRPVELSELDRRVLLRLDGQHDRAAIVAALVEDVARGVLEVQQHGQVCRDPATIRALCAEALEPSLERLAISALFPA